ncbi:MAG: hypothetical protein P8020_07970 [Acidobacteriota bacterium]
MNQADSRGMDGARIVDCCQDSVESVSHEALEEPRALPPHVAGRRQWLMAVALFCLVTVAYTYPLILQARQATLQLGLNYVVMANAKVIGDQLSTGSSPLQTDRILAPAGYTIHEGFLPSLMVYALGLGRDFLVGLNLSLLISFVLASLGAWALAFTLTGSNIGATAAGLFFGFCAMHYANYPLYPIVHIEWIPWHLYAHVRYLGSGRRRFLALAALSLIAASLSSWYFTVFLLLTGSVVTLFYLRSERGWRRAGGYLAAVGASCLVLIPFTPVVLLGRQGLDAGGFRFVVDGSADLLSLIVPPWYHWLFGAPVWRMEANWLGNASLRANYLGTASLVLAVWGLVAGRGISIWLRRSLWVIGAAGLVLALGPFLAVGGLGGWSVGEPIESIRALRLPYYWLADLFPFSVT